MTTTTQRDEERDPMIPLTVKMLDILTENAMVSETRSSGRATAEEVLAEKVLTAYATLRRMFSLPINAEEAGGDGEWPEDWDPVADPDYPTVRAVPLSLLVSLATAVPEDRFGYLDEAAERDYRAQRKAWAERKAAAAAARGAGRERLERELADRNAVAGQPEARD